jgi:general transcription factor 3C polypeptide 6
MESEYEETVEEQYILVEFAGNTGSDALNQENVSIKVLGMETDEPIIKIGNQLYEGKYYDTIGTELFFTEAEGEPPSDTLFDTKLEKKLEFYGKTNTKLVVSRAFAKPLENSKNSADAHLPEETSMSDSDKN